MTRRSSLPATLVLIAALAGCGGDPDDPWASVAQGPLSARAGASAVWTGAEVLVFGGHHLACDTSHCYPRESDIDVDGAAYDPAKDTWRRIAPYPVRAEYTYRAVVGDTVYVAAMPRGPGVEPVATRMRWFAYSLPADAWREIPSPGAGSDPVAVGPTLLAVDSYFRVQAYDPAARNWSRLPSPPTGYRGAPVSDGVSRLYTVGGGKGDNRSAVLDLTTRRWRRLPDAPVAGHGPFHFVAGLIVLPGRETAVYDPGIRRWTLVSGSPDDGNQRDTDNDAFLYPPVVGGDLVVFSSRWALHVPTLTWREIYPHEALGAYADPLLEAADPTVAWAGDRLFVWGGVRRSVQTDGTARLRDAGWTWRP